MVHHGIESYRLFLVSQGLLMPFKIKYLQLCGSTKHDKDEEGVVRTWTWRQRVTGVTIDTLMFKTPLGNYLTKDEFVALMLTHWHPVAGLYRIVDSYPDYPLAKGQLVEITLKSVTQYLRVVRVRSFFLTRWWFGKYKLRDLNTRKVVNLNNVGTTDHGWAKVYSPKYDFGMVNAFIAEHESETVKKNTIYHSSLTKRNQHGNYKEEGPDGQRTSLP